ncbi:MAG: 50S ribosomal protein L6 [Chloroflexota bacterium]
MSRVGKMPVEIPAKVKVTINGHEVSVKGPKGEMTTALHPEMKIVEEDGILHVERPSEARRHRELHGLTRALLNNMVQGVSTGFRKTLIVEGVGYRAEMQGKNLMMYLGYSHPVEVVPPDGITFSIEDRGRLVFVDGIDRQLVGQITANIRNLRPPEPYKGKGVRYDNEVIRRKAGKAGKGK